MVEKKGDPVVAVYDFAGENEDELSFSVGQRLMKTGEVNGWYIGTLEGQSKVGIFPSNFVEPIEEHTNGGPTAGGVELAQAEARGRSTANGLREEDSALNTSTPMVDIAAASSSSAPLYSADDSGHAMAYSSAAVDGSTRSVQSTPSSSPTPPSGAVVVPASAPSVTRSKSTAFAAAEVASLAQMAADSTAPATPRSSMGGGSTSQANVIGGAAPVNGVEPDAIALFKFTAASTDQLSFDKGAKLIIKATLNGWYVGQEIGKQALGIFPANYVQKVDKEPPMSTAAAAPLTSGSGGGVGRDVGVVDDEPSYRYSTKSLEGPIAAAATTAAVSAGSTTGSTASSLSSAPISSTSSASSSSASSAASSSASSASAPSGVPKIIGRVTALYDYHSTTPENLSFSKGEVIPVVKEIKGWWAGYLHGKLGLVPSNYCSPLRADTVEDSVPTTPSATAIAPTSSSASSSSLTATSVKYPLVSGGLPAGVQPVAVLTPSPSPALTSSPVPAAAAAASEMGPPAPPTKPALLSSFAVGANNAAAAAASGYPIVTGSSGQQIQPIAVLAPLTVMPSEARGSTPTPQYTGPASASASIPPSTTLVAPLDPVPTSALTTTPATSSSTSLRPGERLAVALDDWSTREKGELSFRKGDRLIITKEQQGWYTGYVEGTSKKGLFPPPLVQLVPVGGGGADVSTVAPSAAVAASVATTAANTPSVSNPSTPDSHTRNLSLSTTSSPPSTSSSAADASTIPTPSSPAVAQLEGGMVVTKLDQKGRDSKSVRLYLERERLSRGRRGEWIIRWDTKKFNKREAQVTLSKARVKRGLKRSEPFNGKGFPFTVLSPTRDLEVICNAEQEREVWIDALQALNVQLEDGPTTAVARTSLNGVQRQQQLQQTPTQLPQGQVQGQAQGQAEDDDEEVSMTDILQAGPPSAQSAKPMKSLSTGPYNPVADATDGHPLPPLSAPIAIVTPPTPVPAMEQARLATALYDFGTEEGDLTFVAGDKIQLTEALPSSEWWRGKNLTKGILQVGMFPANYVKVDAPPQTTVTKPPLQTQPTGGAVTNNGVHIGAPVPASVVLAPVAFAPTATASAALTPPTHTLPPSSAAAAGPVVKAKAMFDFETDTSQYPDDLPFKQGDVLTLVSYGRDAQGKELEWWRGSDARGRTGAFPAAFVKIIS